MYYLTNSIIIMVIVIMVVVFGLSFCGRSFGFGRECLGRRRGWRGRGLGLGRGRR